MAKDSTPLIYGDIEAHVVQYLRTKLPADVYVGTIVPPVRREKMVIIRKNGGTALGDVRQSAQIGIRTWGKTWGKSMELALLTEAWMNEIAHTGLKSMVLRSETQMSPVASGDGMDAEVPVHYSVHNLIIRAFNI